MGAPDHTPAPLSLRRWPTLLLLGLLLPLAGCFSYQEVTFKGVTGLNVSKLDAQGLALRAMVTLDNPNGFRIHVIDPNVDVFLNDVFIGKATLDSALVLEKATSKDYAVPMHATFDGHGGQALMTIVGAALSGHAKVKAKGTVIGRAFLFRKQFPFEQESEFDLSGQ